MSSKFKARPELRALPDPDAVAAFAAGAEHRATAPIAPTLVTVESAPQPTATAVPAQEPTAPRRARKSGDEAPWEKHDRNAKPLSGINVRLNDYEHELLKYLAGADQRSIQQTIKRLLIPAAEAAARKLRRAE